jgi:hypothetical protein
MNMQQRRMLGYVRRALPLLVLMLAACANLPVPAGVVDLSLPRQVHVVQSEEGRPNLDRLLVVQQEGPASRWSLFDPLGVPLARQLLQSGEWRSDGLLPPNKEARVLFAALIFAWTPPARLDTVYGAGNWRDQTLPDGHRRILLQGDSPRWTIEWSAKPADQDVFTIAEAGGIRWRVAPLKEQP